jgi:hypothetical protein
MPKLNMRFDSSAITAAAYDTDAGILDIWYKGGDRYSYFDVPPHIYQELGDAPSAGEYVNLEIKPNYRYEIEARRRRFRPST